MEIQPDLLGYSLTDRPPRPDWLPSDKELWTEASLRIRAMKSILRNDWGFRDVDARTVLSLFPNIVCEDILLDGIRTMPTLLHGKSWKQEPARNIQDVVTYSLVYALELTIAFAEMSEVMFLLNFNGVTGPGYQERLDSWRLITKSNLYVPYFQIVRPGSEIARQALQTCNYRRPEIPNESIVIVYSNSSKLEEHTRFRNTGGAFHPIRRTAFDAPHKIQWGTYYTILQFEIHQRIKDSLKLKVRLIRANIERTHYPGLYYALICAPLQ